MHGLIIDNFAGGGEQTLIALPEVAMITQVGRVDRMPSIGAQRSWKSDQRKIVRNRKAAGIEKNMMVRAQAQQILCHIRTVVRAAEGANVGSFGIRSSCAFQADAAGLAGIVVQCLDGTAHRGVANDTLHFDGDSFYLGTSFLLSVELRIAESLQLEAAHLKAITPGLVPIALDAIQSVIAIARVRAKFPVLATAEQAYWEAAQTASHQRGIAPSIEGLVCNLLAVVAAPATAVASIDDYVAVILVIWIPSREHYRRCASAPVSSDPSIGVLVHPSVIDSPPVLELRSHLEPWNASDHQRLPQSDWARFRPALISQIGTCRATSPADRRDVFGARGIMSQHPSHPGGRHVTGSAERAPESQSEAGRRHAGTAGRGEISSRRPANWGQA